MLLSDAFLLRVAHRDHQEILLIDGSNALADKIRTTCGCAGVIADGGKAKNPERRFLTI
jgi:hypothetical protein